MECRTHCGACCIAPSITSPIPGMPNGKPAGVACIQLLDDFGCAIFGSKDRPDVCKNFMPEKAICADNKEEAISILNFLEEHTC